MGRREACVPKGSVRTPSSSIARRLGKARVLVFDFDGTLVDSNEIKRNAFERLFPDFPDHQGRIRRYCRRGNHTPRWEKLRHIVEKILRLPYTPEMEHDLLKRYEEATTRRIIGAPEIPGAERFLARAASRGETALLSSTPESILRRILKARGWRPYFKTVRGAPVDKGAWLARFRRQRRLRREEILFFGDTPEDRESARQAGCAFIRVGSRGFRA